MQITFSDIGIKPSYSEVDSRTNVDISSDMGKFKLELPVISANMPQITEHKMAVTMQENGGMGILHRFMDIDENVRQLIKSGGASVPGTPYYNVGVSVGIKDEEKERIVRLYEAGARIFCVDIAHGHSKGMKNMIEYIKPLDGVVIIAGNVATAEGALDLCSWGADVIKVGVGPGSRCLTRMKTGVGVPQFSALDYIRDRLDYEGMNDVKLIADGGIKQEGDVAKALIHADAVMVGAVLAGTSETPGNAFPEPGTNLTNRTYYKMYGGSASFENKVANGQSGRFNEGEMIKVPFKGHAKYLLREVEDGLRSAFSYAGASNLTEYKKNVKWAVMSSGGKSESKV